MKKNNKKRNDFNSILFWSCKYNSLIALKYISYRNKSESLKLDPTPNYRHFITKFSTVTPSKKKKSSCVWEFETSFGAWQRDRSYYFWQTEIAWKRKRHGDECAPKTISTPPVDRRRNVRPSCSRSRHKGATLASTIFARLGAIFVSRLMSLFQTLLPLVLDCVVNASAIEMSSDYKSLIIIHDPSFEG